MATVPSAKPLQQQNENPFDNKPWATLPVDRLICGLDGQGYDYDSIVRQVKHKVSAYLVNP